MKIFMALKISIASVFLLVLACTPGNATRQPDNTFTKNKVDNWMKELSNWGRWGTEDQLGTVNLITPQKRVEASSLADLSAPCALPASPARLQFQGTRNPAVCNPPP